MTGSDVFLKRVSNGTYKISYTAPIKRSVLLVFSDQILLDCIPIISGLGENKNSVMDDYLVYCPPIHEVSDRVSGMRDWDVFQTTETDIKRFVFHETSDPEPAETSYISAYAVLAANWDSPSITSDIVPQWFTSFLKHTQYWFPDIYVKTPEQFDDKCMFSHQASKKKDYFIRECSGILKQAVVSFK